MAIGVSPCPPFNNGGNDVPQVLFDGNTVGWFKHNDSTTIIKDGANRVSQWSDKTGLGHHLLQAVGASQPLWSADGILFDGVNDFMKCAPFAFIQPSFVYFVGKHVTYGVGLTYLHDGNLLDSLDLIHSAAGISPELAILAGVLLGQNNNLPINTFGIIRELFNGLNSSLQINKTAALIGNAGNSNSDGFTLGCNSGGATFFGNIKAKEIILRKSSDSVTVQDQIYNYLKNVNGI
jgi:hypothetical protein